VVKPITVNFSRYGFIMMGDTAKFLDLNYSAIYRSLNNSTVTSFFVFGQVDIIMGFLSNARNTGGYSWSS
jgi:hypothetical protein